jgi:hypothetical protein
VLGFLFGSTMVLVMAGGLAAMAAIRRHSKFRKITSWLAFGAALIAGSAAAMCFVGQWASTLLTGALAMVGAPSGAVGVLSLFGALAMAADLLDKRPDGMARLMALILPTLLLATGGELGMYGGQAVTAVSDAGARLLGNLIGLGV